MRFGTRPGAVMLLMALLGASGCRPDGTGGSLVDVQGAVLARPESVDFGLVALGQERELKVVFRNNSRLPVAISRLSTTLASVTVSDAGGFTLKSAQEHEVVVRFAPGVEGEVTGQLVAETDLRGDARLRRVPLRGMGVRSYVDIQPPALGFDRVELDTSRVLPVEAHNPTPADAVFTLSFTGADADVFSSPEAGVELRVGPGERRQVPITFRPLRLGPAQATAVLTRCPICAPESVSLSGEGVTAQLDISPTRLSYGRVALGGRAEQSLTLRNAGNEPVTFLRAWMDRGEGLYSVVNPPPQTVLQQSQSVDLTVAFQPPTPGPQAGLLKVEVQEGNTPVRRYTVALTGEGGATCITFLPGTLDFGTVPEGMRLERQVHAINTCQEDVALSDLAVHTTQGGPFLLVSPAASVMVPAGKQVPVTVAFTPDAGGGSSEGQLTAVVQHGSLSGTESVALRGSSRVFAPCQYRVDPVQLPFGEVQVGSTVTLGVALTNVGSDDCFVARMGMAGGSAPAFSADAFPGGPVAPGAKAVLTVAFHPEAMGPFSGEVEGVVNHPTNGRFTVPVSGEGVQSCLALEPATVDFGTSRLTCGERQQQVVAINRCNDEVHLTAAALEGATSGDLRLVAPPALPLELDEGEQVAFTLAYTPTDEGEDSAALRVTSAEQGSLTAGVVGRGLEKPTQTDRSVQVVLEKVDVLFVIDNSGSMKEEQQSLGQNLAAFLSAAQGGGVDYRIGVTTTGIEPPNHTEHPCPGGAEGGEAGRLFPADSSAPRIITPQTPLASAVFAHNTRVGVCHWKEQGLEAAYRALSPPLSTSADDPLTSEVNDGNGGFLREDARLAIIIVTDEQDFSPHPVAFYEAYFKGLKGNDPNLLTISAIVGPDDLSTCRTASSSGTRYLALAKATRGVTESICTADWASSLRKLSDATFGLRSIFPLSQKPPDPGQISVTVNGRPVTTGWTYDAASNSVLFVPGALPPAGTVVEVSYPLGC